MKPKKKWSKRDYQKLVLETVKKKRKENAKNKSNANMYLYGMLSKDNANKKQRNLLINSLDNKQMKGIQKLTKNFLASKYPLDPKQLKHFAKYKKSIYALQSAKTPLSMKKNILKQKGGFLHSLIPLAVSLGADLISGIIKKK